MWATDAPDYGRDLRRDLLVSELLEIADRIVERTASGERLEAYVARGVETDVRVYEGEIETLSTATSAGVGVRALLDGPDGSRVGFAWAGSLEDEAIERALRSARENATFATPDPMVTFATPDGVVPAAVSVSDPSFAAFSIDDKISLALETERLARSSDARIRQVDSADYGDTSVEFAIASSMGVRAAADRTAAYLSVAAIAGDADETQTGSGLSVGRGPGSLDPASASNQAVERSARMLGATKIASTKTVVVFDPRVTSTLLGVIAGALSGEAVVKGRSFFEGRLGEQVAVPSFTFVDDPTNPRAFGAARFDGEGLACRPNTLIDGGVLRGFVYDTVAANRAGTSSTGSAVRGGFAGTPGAGCRAVVLMPGTKTPDEVVASVGTGVYVQSITGVHSGVSPVSGDFSVGAEGLVIRDGQFCEPFREVTVASTLQRMLQSIVEVGADLTWLPGVAAGQTLAIADFQLSGS
jgi:PmbA protein